MVTTGCLPLQFTIISRCWCLFPFFYSFFSSSSSPSFLSLRPQRECSITTHVPVRVPPAGCHEAGGCAREHVPVCERWCTVGARWIKGSRGERERAPYVTWSRTSEQIDEAKAIKWEEGFASLERWLPWICEWIKKRSAWMTAWMKEQWMNTIELSPPHLIHPLNLLMMKLLTKKAN